MSAPTAPTLEPGTHYGNITKTETIQNKSEKSRWEGSQPVMPSQGPDGGLRVCQKLDHDEASGAVSQTCSLCGGQHLSKLYSGNINLKGS